MGRTTWSEVITGSRETMRLACAYFGDNDLWLRGKLACWVAAYAWSLRDHVLRHSDLKGRLEGLLEPHEVEAVMDPMLDNRPLQVLAVLTEIVKEESGGDQSLRVAMLESLSELEARVASAERLLKTPIPLSYTRHTSRFLIAYLTFLPLGLWYECGWGLVPISAVVAFFLLGIDEIGIQLEEPFSGLPLERYCQSIESEALIADRMHNTAVRVLAESRARRGANSKELLN
mmetsp:Transcript_30109/g.85003  ORF Transcript_30109/g.85003 Transcript_30109/m.85003 type:complete len:231 (+) Transcript_30109:242-934(+)